MTDERQADRDATRSAWRKVMPALSAAGVDPDAVQKVRDMALTEREAAVMAGFMEELDELIRGLREDG